MAADTDAAVCFFSMATSSGEEIPRHLEFLFSRNRLNVAISRARCLGVLVCNPALLNIWCKNPEQMGLMNALLLVMAPNGSVEGRVTNWAGLTQATQLWLVVTPCVRACWLAGAAARPARTNRPVRALELNR
jgi:hypothetical protein